MAIVNVLKKSVKVKEGKQNEVSCAYKILKDEHGKATLQVETFRSDDMKMEGDPKQIIKFSNKATKQLAKILFNDILLKED